MGDVTPRPHGQRLGNTIVNSGTGEDREEGTDAKQQLLPRPGEGTGDFSPGFLSYSLQK